MDARAKHFIQLWTLKEAHVKALGRGILAAPGMSAFAVDLPWPNDSCHAEGLSRASICLDTDNDMWSFRLFEVGKQHIAAVCVERSPLQQSSAKLHAPSVFLRHLQTPEGLRMWKTLPGVFDQELTDWRLIATS